MGKPKRNPPKRDGHPRPAWASLLSEPSGAAALSDDELDALVSRAALLCGRSTAGGETLAPAREIYATFMGRVPAERRRDNYLATATAATVGRTGVGALLPYLLREDVPGIVATAALDYAVLRPLDDGDALAGPRRVLGLAQDGEVANRAAAIGGLLMMGDARVNALLEPLRRGLADEDVAVIARCQTGFLFAATIGFYLEWLGELQQAGRDGAFGFLAGALCRMRIEALVPSVWSIERCFPTRPGEPFRLLGSWPAEEYAGIIRHRLEAIAERETGDRVMPLVMEAWGLS